MDAMFAVIFLALLAATVLAAFGFERLAPKAGRA
jgi:hypothetical protein